MQKIEITEKSANYIIDPNNKDNASINIKIKSKNPEKRNPLFLITMLDVSGSMSLNACNEVNGMEDLSFSRLNLVKHSMNTIISILEEDDILCIITFSEKGKIILPPMKMEKKGKEDAFEKIKEMDSQNSTNIWDALRIGVLEANKYKDSIYSTHLLLFTDGEPNENPEIGIIPSLQNLLKDIELTFTISTFAFGYNVDSELMENISKIGNGVYGYCPDCTMVGTIFINFMSNILTIISNVVQICVSYNNININENIGSVYYDVYRNYLINVPIQFIKDVKIKVNLISNHQSFDIPIGEEIKDDKGKEEILDQYYRFKLIDLIKKNIHENKEETKNEIKQLFDEINGIKNKSQYLNGLLIDLIDDDPNHGQIDKAFDKKYYNKWGKDYLRSFLLFHITEQCGNFKDESLQLYGGEQFKEYRKKCNKIFLEIPPPEGNKYEDNDDDVDMDRFYDYYGGCFNGNGIVKLQNNKIKKVKELNKGDILLNGNIIDCVIKTKVKSYQFVVEINNVLLTPYHPIFYNGNWVFPINIKKPIRVYIDYWYNVIVKNGFSIVINDIEVVGLAHQQNYGILYHPYFGSQKVVDALKKYDGFEQGFVFIKNIPKVVRDENHFISEYY
jgi:Mg-chelatase subunit ChlD